ncbi:hypothetical protein [Aquibacillus sediminis]|uniref:hypothetical protein n=1 Tax=Aquibacillus sediminis TaxID=2574734 RepID=UPI0011084038|nr:hypothetical protein [Aquibacillus sediminis]
MRKYVLLMICLILLSACSSEDDVDFDKTMIITGKVIQKDEKIENRVKYYIEVLTIIDQTKESIMLEVEDRNVWNLILKDEVYRISFDTKDGQGYQVNSPIISIKTVGPYDKTFQENLNDLN